MIMKSSKLLNKLLIITFLALIASLVALVVVCIYTNLPNDNQSNYQGCEVTNTPKIEKSAHYTVTSAERELLAKIVYLESSVCSLDTQKDVCSVVFNRLESGKWEKDMNSDGKITLYDIVYYPCAFSPVLEGKMDSCVPDANAYKAVDYVIKNGPTIPTYVRYFRSDRHFTEWYDEGYIGYHDRDNMYFGYFEGWEQGQW